MACAGSALVSLNFGTLKLILFQFDALSVSFLYMYTTTINTEYPDTMMLSTLLKESPNKEAVISVALEPMYYEPTPPTGHSPAGVELPKALEPHPGLLSGCHWPGHLTQVAWPLAII